MVALQGLVSHRSKVFEAGLEQKRVDVARRLDERISHLYDLCSTSKVLQQTEPEPASGRHRQAISNMSSLTATTRAPTVQMCHSARRLEQFGNQSNYSMYGASHDNLRLCGSGPLWDSPSTQAGRDILRPCGSISLLSTSRTEADGDFLFSSGSIPPSNTLRRQHQPFAADDDYDALGHRVETIHQMEKSAVGGKPRRDLEFHIRKIHEIEQQGSSLGETSTLDSSQIYDTHSIHFESHDSLPVPDSSRSIKLNHSILSSQSPHSMFEHPNSALSRVQKEVTKARGVSHERNSSYEYMIMEGLEAEQSEVEALRLEVLATRQDLDNERERASLREKEFTHRMERALMQTNCANCKNYQLKIGDLERTLATREHELAVDDCAELTNLKLQLAHEVEQRSLMKQACDTANAAKEEYVLKFEKLNTEHQKQQVSLAQLKKINAGLELQRASSAEVDKQRQEMCDHQSALLRKLETELEQARRDLVIEREYAVRLLLQIQQLQLEVKREKERSSSQEIQLRDAFEEIKQHSQHKGSGFRKVESSLDEADLNVSQRKTELQQVTWERDGLRMQQEGKHSLISDLQQKIDAQAQKKIRDEHAFLKQVEVVLGEAVEDMERKKLKAAEDLTGASHLEADANHAKWLTSVHTEVKVVVDQKQETTTIEEVSPRTQSVQERSPGWRDWLTSRNATKAFSPAQDCGIVPPKSETFGELLKPQERHDGCPPVVSFGPLSCMGV